MTTRPTPSTPNHSNPSARARIGGTSTPHGASVWDIGLTTPEPVEEATPRAPAPPVAPIAAPVPAPAEAEPRRQVALPADEPVPVMAPLLDEDRLERLERSLPTIATEPIGAPDLEPVFPPAESAPAPAVAEPRPRRSVRRERSSTPRSQRTVDPRLLIGLVAVLVVAGVAFVLARSGGEVASSAPVEADDAVPSASDTDLPLDPDGLLSGTWDDEPEPAAPAVADPVAEDATDTVEDAPSIAVAEPVEPVDAVDVVETDDADEPTVPAEEPAGADVDQPVTPEPADEPAEEAGEEPAEEVVVAEEPAEEPIVEPEPEAEPAPPADGRAVEITSRTEPCKFSNNCLIVGFTITGFDTVPDEFVCEFSSGARYSFELPASTINSACKTGRIGDSITVEIDGVRSDTIVHS